MEVIKTRMDEAEEQISDTEDKTIKNNESEKKKRERKVMDHKDRLRELSNLQKYNNIRIIGVPEDEEREKGADGLFKQMIAETSLIWGRTRHQNPGSTENTHEIQQKLTIAKPYHSENHKIHKQGKNPESSKGKKVLNLKGKTHQVHSRSVH